MIDLHMHSHCSDGEMTPEELVQWGKNIGLTAMAISDHDTTVGSLCAMDQGEKIGQKVLSAVEITTSYKGHVLHLLAYDFPYHHQELSQCLSEIQSQRIGRAEIIITGLNDDLKAEGLEIIEPSEILKLGQEKPITRSDIALYLLKNKYIASIQEAFDRWLFKYKIPSNNFSISEAIDLVRSIGGVAVLAHPFAQNISLKAISFDLKSQVDMLKELRAFGLDGFEAFYFRGNPEIEKLYGNIAVDLGIIATGGSDFHGKSYTSVAAGIGENNAPDRVIDEIHILSASRR